MPLSEHEQKLLDQMEQALYAEDPRFANQMQTVARRRSHVRHLIGLAGVIVGLGLVLLGVNTTWIIGAVGFLVMVAALAFAFSPPREKATVGVVQQDGTVAPKARTGKPRRGSSRGSKRATAARSTSGGSFMARMEERWERRRGGW